MKEDKTYFIRPMQETDWLQVHSIYKEGITTGEATFELKTPDWEEWHNTHLTKCRIVAEENNKILGWAALSSVNDRCVYSGVAEVSVYVGEKARGKGLGKILLKKLIEESEQNNIWTLQAGIFPENVPSVALHKVCGFREIGARKKLGKLNGVWRDVLLLERRSEIVGVD